MKFQKRNSIVEATQWFSAGDHPAVQLQGDTWSIATPEGWIEVLPGDWVITSAEGVVYRMRDSLFSLIYEPLSGW